MRACIRFGRSSTALTISSPSRISILIQKIKSRSRSTTRSASRIDGTLFWCSRRTTWLCSSRISFQTMVFHHRMPPKSTCRTPFSRTIGTRLLSRRWTSQLNLSSRNPTPVLTTQDSISRKISSLQRDKYQLVAQVYQQMASIIWVVPRRHSRCSTRRISIYSTNSKTSSSTGSATGATSFSQLQSRSRVLGALLPTQKATASGSASKISTETSRAAQITCWRHSLSFAFQWAWTLTKSATRAQRIETLRRSSQRTKIYNSQTK